MKQSIAAPIVFLTSAATLVLEILAGRLLAQYVGISLDTFTGIIGTVLAGIAAGTWAGGALADRLPPRRLLGPVITLAGVAVLLTVPIIRLLGPGVPNQTMGIIVLTAAGFFVPAALLSSTSPIVVKMVLSDLDQTGAVVGRLSALGTAGALVGTYMTGFVLVAAAPTTAIITVIGVAVVALGIVTTLMMDRLQVPVTAGLSALAVLGGGLTLGLDGPCDRESAYHCIEVVSSPSDPGGRLLLLDTARNSFVDLDDPTRLEFSYAIWSEAILDTIPDGPITTLHVGGGGFTLAKYLDTVRPGSKNLVLEIDPALIDVGEDELGLVQSDLLQVEAIDARLGIADEADDSYDLVIGDAFTGYSVPWHLTTREFVAELDRVLIDDGLYIMNLIDRPPLRYARAQVATLLEQFENVIIITNAADLDGAVGGNFVVAASHQPFDIDQIAADLNAVNATTVATSDPNVADNTLTVHSGSSVDSFASDDILRDDFAPVDQWRTGP